MPQSVLVADLSFNSKSKQQSCILSIRHVAQTFVHCVAGRYVGYGNVLPSSTPGLQVKLRVKLHVVRHVATPRMWPNAHSPTVVSSPQLVSNLSFVLKQIQQKIYLENCRHSAFVLH